MKNVAKIVAVAGILAGLLSGCGSAEIEKVDNQTSAAPAAEQKKETPATHDLKVGDKVKVDNLEVTLNGVRVADTYDGKALVADFTVNNVGDKTENVSSMLMFEAMDEEAIKLDQTVGVEDQKGQLDGELAPGRKLRGEIAYKLKDAHGKTMELIFQEAFKSGQAIWKVPVNQ